MTDNWQEILGGACLAAGSLVMLLSAFGFWRMKDVYCRMHTAGLTDVLGLPLIAIGAGLFMADWLVMIKLLMVLGFAYVTSATATHALSQSALSSHIVPAGAVPRELKQKQAEDA